MADFINLSDIASRLREVLERSGLNATDFCRETDLAPSSFSQMLSSKIKVNVETINKIVLRWGATIDPLWLLLGDNAPTSPRGGDLFASTSSDSTQEISAPVTELISEVVRLKGALADSKPKRIDKITVFYTDKSYEVYRLCQDE